MLTSNETQALGALLIVIMLGMGASLTFKDFAIALRKPSGLLIGILCQYGFMPVAAFLAARLLSLPPGATLGLILVACMPGGTASNIFAYFSKGALPLSILMTLSSTMVAIVMVPLMLKIYTSGVDANWQIPIRTIFEILALLLVPTLLGVLLRRFSANVGAIVELIGGGLGFAVIVYLALTWVPRNWDMLSTTGPQVYLAVIGLGPVGFLMGYHLARTFRQDKRRARTIALEIGIQNGPLAILIASLTFSGPRQQEILLVPILYSLFIILSSSAATIWFRCLSKQEDAIKLREKFELSVETR